MNNRVVADREHLGDAFVRTVFRNISDNRRPRIDDAAVRFAQSGENLRKLVLTAADHAGHADVSWRCTDRLTAASPWPMRLRAIAMSRSLMMSGPVCRRDAVSTGGNSPIIAKVR